MNKFQDIKKYLDKAKKNIKNSFSKKQDGLLAAIEQTNLTDEILRAVFQIHSKNNEFKNTALCAIGGYGRSQLAPFSDIDIIFLINNHIDKEIVEKDIRETLYKLWDLDFKIGYSVRKINYNKLHIIYYSIYYSILYCYWKGSVPERHRESGNMCENIGPIVWDQIVAYSR